MGMNGSASFKVDFTGVELDEAHLIGRAGDYQRQPWLSAGAIRFAAVQLGGADALFDVARAELRSLGRDGDPHQRARFGQMAVAVESGRLWLRGAAPHLDEAHACAHAGTLDDATAERVVAYVNMARTAIERIGLETIELVERSVGVRGMLKPHPMERLVRDLSTYLRQPAPDAALTDAGLFALESEATSASLWGDPR
jgi:alkylation response protein AidB-like acyl-CoA dehydrogenase